MTEGVGLDRQMKMLEGQEWDKAIMRTPMSSVERKQKNSICRHAVGFILYPLLLLHLTHYSGVIVTRVPLASQVQPISCTPGTQDWLTVSHMHSSYTKLVNQTLVFHSMMAPIFPQFEQVKHVTFICEILCTLLKDFIGDHQDRGIWL